MPEQKGKETRQIEEGRLKRGQKEMENLKEGESGRAECISAPPAEMRDERHSVLEDTYISQSQVQYKKKENVKI